MIDWTPARRRAALASVSLLALSFPALALAQATPTPAPATPPPASTASPSDTEVEGVIITGSRIRRSEYSSSSPITVITGDQSTLEGLADTAEILQTSSVASGSVQINNQLTGYAAIGTDVITPGANYISLRGLGANRTLVLLNGRRMGPAGIGGRVGAFDLNVLPQSIVTRTEILKDGASSIYGSDAVAGVINVFTKTDLDGLQFSVYGNRSQDGGGDKYQANMSWGKTFNRGYLNVSADYYEQQEMKASQRKDTACAADYLFNPTTGARVDYMSALNPSSYKCYNLPNNYVQTTTWGNLVPVMPGITYPTAAQGNIGASNAPIPAGYARWGRAGYPATYPYAPYETPLYDNLTVISPTQRTTVFASGGYDLTPTVELFGELLYNRRESNQIGVGQIFPSFAQLSTLFGAANVLPASNPNNPFGQSVVPVTAYESASYQTVDYLRAVGGIRGDASLFNVNWEWEVYGQWSKSDATYNNGRRVYLDRLLALYSPGTACTNTPLGGNVSGFSCSALPNGIPWTSPRILSGNFTDAERAFLFFTEEGSTTYDHKYIEATASGDLFTLPAGTVGAAVGVHFRKEEIDDTPGAIARARNMALFSSANRTAGSDSVKEAFAEFSIPVLKGGPLVESFDLNISGRYSDYESYGSNGTYKVGANWQIIPALRVRATQGTSFRAPSLYEQYLGALVTYQSQQIDPCYNYGIGNVSATVAKNCAALGIAPDYVASGSSSVIVNNNGGAGVLTAETATARTLGVIWTPSFIDLSVALDFFSYDVDDEVRQFGASNILLQCLSRPDFPNNAYCSLVNRDPASKNIRTVNNSYVNVADQTSRGIDLSTRFTRDELFGGRLVVDTEFTWQTKDTTLLLAATDPIDENGSTLQPDFTGQASARYERGDWTFLWSADLIGKASDTELAEDDVFPFTRYANLPAGVSSADCTAPNNYCVYYKQFTEFMTYHSASVRYRKDDWTLAAGLQNVFNEQAPAQSNGQFRVGTAALNLFDLIGRRGWVSVSRRF